MEATMTLKEKLTELIRDRLIYASGIRTGDLFQRTAEITVENIFMFLDQEKPKSAIWESLRPSVQYFAVEMERELKRNDNKGGWDKDHCAVSYLEDRLIQELGEYYKKRDIDELVDIANFCMMVYSRNGGLPKEYLK